MICKKCGSLMRNDYEVVNVDIIGKETKNVFAYCDSCQTKINLTQLRKLEKDKRKMRVPETEHNQNSILSMVGLSISIVGLLLYLVGMYDYFILTGISIFIAFIDLFINSSYKHWTSLVSVMISLLKVAIYIFLYYYPA